MRRKFNLSQSSVIHQINQRTIILLILMCLLSASTFSQWTEYKITGRVVDENGKPISEAYIRVAPLKYMMEYSVPTKDDGRFSINKKIKNGDTWFLYVSQYTQSTEYARTLIDPPFFGVNKINKRFLGKPITFGDEKIVDVGDVNIQFWFNAVYFKFQINGRKLKEEEWTSLWCRLKDEKGRILAESSIGPTVKADEIDLNKSVMKLSLPEGKWKVEFQKFDYDKNKIYPEIIGQTDYFRVNKNKETETIIVSVNKKVKFISLPFQ